MITPSTIALVIGLVMIFADIHPKNIVWDAITGVGTLQKYIGLIYIGADIGRRGFKKLFENPRVLVSVPIKLVIIPIAFFFILKATGLVSDGNASCRNNICNASVNADYFRTCGGIQCGTGLFGSVINSDNSMLSVHNADCFLIPCRLLYIIINNN